MRKEEGGDGGGREERREELGVRREEREKRISHLAAGSHTTPRLYAIKTTSQLLTKPWGARVSG